MASLTATHQVNNIVKLTYLDDDLNLEDRKNLC